MPTEYNLDFLDNSTNIVNIYTGINTASGSLFAYMILIVIWVIFVILLAERGVVKAMFFSSFLVTVVSVIFLGIGLVTTPIFGICLAMTIISGFITYNTND